MSAILIRKYCQPVLDEAGYPMFYATVDSDSAHSPYLEIRTNCGKPFVNVHGVQFSRFKPSIEECKYSGTLLRNWFDRHAQDFEEYVDAYLEWYSLEKPPHQLEEKRLGVQFAVYDTDMPSVQRTFDYTDEDNIVRQFDMQYKYNAELGVVTSVNWPKHVHLDNRALAAKVQIPKAVVDKINGLRDPLKAFYQERDELHKRLEAAEKQVKSCTI